ncbi:MAG: hypothetical protein J5I99_06870 [Verrucomicrobia bacterium]|nr:hypothetical protein [Verrucomicrobiota bacterium]
MNALRQISAFAFRVFALIVFGLVLFFPQFKGLWIVYGPMLVALGLAAAVHQRLRAGWEPLATLRTNTFWIVAVIGPAIVQIGLVFFLRPNPVSDGKFVFDEALTLAATGRMSLLTYYPPAQTWWYALWFKLLAPTALIAQLSHIPLHTLVTLLTFALVRLAAPRFARAAAFVVAWYPSFLGYVLTTPYYHYLYTACVVATAWGWLASLKKPSASFGAGLASGIGALTKATQLIAPAQSAVFWLLAPLSGDASAKSTWRRALIHTGIFTLAMACAIAPWAYRNANVFGEPVLVCTSGGLVFHSANNEHSNGLYSDLPDAVSIGSPRAMLEHSRESSRLAEQFIRENPKHFLALVWNKILHTWGGEATFTELINHRGQPLGRLDDVFSLAFFLGWVFIAGLWAASSIAAIRARAPLSALELAAAIVIFSNALVFAIFEGGDRHHLPLVPLIVATLFSRLADRPKGG